MFAAYILDMPNPLGTHPTPEAAEQQASSFLTKMGASDTTAWHVKDTETGEIVRKGS